MAHKKAAGSAKNLRDSNAKYRGVKLFAGQQARAGNIIVRQKGDVYTCGHNVYKGKDFTIHAQIDGVVSYRKKNITKFDGRKYLKTIVDIVPAGEVAQPVHTTAPQKAPKAAPAKKAATPKPEKAPTKTAAKKAHKETEKPVKKEAEKAVEADNEDLAVIDGIGPKVKEALQNGGIMTVADLAKADEDEVKKILEAAGGRAASMDPAPWIKQAKKLA